MTVSEAPLPGEPGRRTLARHRFWTWAGSPAINARATLSAAGRSQLRELRSGSTYQSQNALELHFGLGAATVIDTLEICWPEGKKSLIREVRAGQTLTLKEPAAGSTREKH